MIWLIVSVLLWGTLHSLLASHAAKETFCRRFGEKAARFYRLGYNLFAGLSFLPVLALAALLPDRLLYLVPLPWSALMALGMILALAALVAGFLQTDAWDFIGLKQLSQPSAVRPEAMRLTTSGLYRYVRHPLYSAGIAFIWLTPRMTANVLALNIALTVYIVSGAFLEERKLRRDFGQAYADYAAVTPMFIPFARWNKK